MNFTNTGFSRVTKHRILTLTWHEFIGNI